MNDCSAELTVCQSKLDRAKNRERELLLTIRELRNRLACRVDTTHGTPIQHIDPHPAADVEAISSEEGQISSEGERATGSAVKVGDSVEDLFKPFASRRPDFEVVKKVSSLPCSFARARSLNLSSCSRLCKCVIIITLPRVLNGSLFSSFSYNLILSNIRSIWVITEGDLVWETCPDAAYIARAAQRIQSEGICKPCRNKAMDRLRTQGQNELIAHLSGAYYYLGTYTIGDPGKFGPEEFERLPKNVREGVISSTGTSFSRCKELREKLCSGEVTTLKFPVRKVGRNSKLSAYLQNMPGSFN
ncbi:hypothetical protein B0H21DRAFT_28157 [Amylocystis lapponica]|nr:hypothetical protein B0H21DRAFT_28157 [Amylocystis lapponica]